MKPAVLLFALLSTPLIAQAELSADLQGKYNRACMACHMVGVAGAPKTGDAEAWAPRLEKGMDTLIASIRQGLNAMPAGGMCADCTDEEYTALINFMAGVEE
jgi:cytochrome c5